MAGFKEQLSSGRAVLWLEYVAYAARLLSGGSVPWLNSAELIAWYRKAQGLLKSDVVALPAGAIAAEWVRHNAALAGAMREKKRVLHPLKTLLADEALRRQLAETLAGMRASLQGTVLALAIPSPRLWVGEAYALAHGSDDEPEIGDDEADSAAVYIADFLRSFGESGIDVLLIAETAATEPRSAEQFDLYRPVANVAAHYRWALGLQQPAAAWDGADAALDFVLAPQTQPAGSTGLMLPEDFWSGAPAAQAAFRYSVVPEQAQPEAVLERLAVLRTA